MTQTTPVSLSRSKETRYRLLGKVGSVVSYTSIAVGPNGLKKRTPYLIAIVDFGAMRATLPLADVSAGEVKNGMKVVGVMRRMSDPSEDGIISYGVKCVPVVMNIRKSSKNKNNE